MDKNDKIFIAGHTGLIGSAIVKQLRHLGFNNLILREKHELNLTNPVETDTFFKQNKPVYAILAAGKTSGISGNIKFPADLIYENTLIETNVIQCSYKYGVKRLLYFGCSCMYPKDCPQPMKEDYLFSGELESTSEFYAIAKLTGLKMCQAYNKQYKTNFLTVIPSNVYGINDHFNGNGHVIPDMIKIFHKTKSKNKNNVKLSGSGKPLRDFIFAGDVAEICISILNINVKYDIINIGSGTGISIRELSEMIKEITGFKGKIIFDKTHPDGMMNKVLNIKNIKNINLVPKTSLEDGIKLVYNSYLKPPPK